MASFSAPEGLAAPTLTSTNPSSVNIAWSEPLKPNGVVISYRIERRVKGQTTVTNVQSFSPNAVKSYADRSAALSPHTTYEYRVGAISNAGTGYSPWAEVTTKASREFMNANIIIEYNNHMLLFCIRYRFKL